MTGETVNKVEAVAAAVASAMLAGALAFCAFALATSLPLMAQAAVAVFAGLAGFASSWGLLTAIGQPRRDFVVTTFDLGAIDPIAHQMDALELVEVRQEPLELVDVLEQPGPGSSVVRLFDPAAMPTPGELRARIDRHLGRGAPPVASPDASQALVDALTQLRHSLR